MEFTTGLGHLPTVTLGSLLSFLNLNFFFFNMEIITIIAHSYLEKNILPGT